MADKLLWTNTNSNQAPNAGQNKKYSRFEYDGFGQFSKRDRRATTGGSRRIHHFHWDTQGRLRQINEGTNTKFTAVYAADGERVSKTDDATGSHLFSFGLHDTGHGGTLYTPGLSHRRGATDRFFHPDWLGSTRYLSDATGVNFPTALRYTAFGKTSAQAGPDDPTYFQFAGAWGYETEAQNGLDLHYLYQRYYDPQVGRFISRDPIRWAGGLNLYGYCRNNPVTGVDPSGLVIETVWDIAVLFGDAALIAWDELSDAPPEVKAINRAAFAIDAFAVAVPGMPGGGGRVMAFARMPAVVRTTVQVSRVPRATLFGVRSTATLASARSPFRVIRPPKGCPGVSQEHHVATNKSVKSGFTAQFERMFERAGLSLNDPANRVFLFGHRGRHSPKYHQWVLDRLRSATSGPLTNQEYGRRLTSELAAIKRELRSNPELLRGIGL